MELGFFGFILIILVYIALKPQVAKILVTVDDGLEVLNQYTAEQKANAYKRLAQTEVNPDDIKKAKKLIESMK